jgi:hypothetical protein
MTAPITEKQRDMVMAMLRAGKTYNHKTDPEARMLLTMIQHPGRLREDYAA